MVEALVCGFEAFGGRRTNRSWQAVAGLKGVETRRLPVEFQALSVEVPRLVQRSARCLLLVGESARARGVVVETVALNVKDTDRPDNAGIAPRGESVVPGAALALQSPWSPPEIVAAIHATGISVDTSFHAGTFACNAALYLGLHAADRTRHKPWVAFIHVSSAPWPRGPRVEQLTLAVQAALDALRSQAAAARTLRRAP